MRSHEDWDPLVPIAAKMGYWWAYLKEVRERPEEDPEFDDIDGPLRGEILRRCSCGASLTTAIRRLFPVSYPSS